MFRWFAKFCKHFAVIAAMFDNLFNDKVNSVSDLTKACFYQTFEKSGEGTGSPLVQATKPYRVVKTLHYVMGRLQARSNHTTWTSVFWSTAEPKSSKFACSHNIYKIGGLRRLIN
jgi:hypothetical protein